MNDKKIDLVGKEIHQFREVQNRTQRRVYSSGVRKRLRFYPWSGKEILENKK